MNDRDKGYRGDPMHGASSAAGVHLHNLGVRDREMDEARLANPGRGGASSAISGMNREAILLVGGIIFVACATIAYHAQFGRTVFRFSEEDSRDIGFDQYDSRLVLQIKGDDYRLAGVRVGSSNFDAYRQGSPYKNLRKAIDQSRIPLECDRIDTGPDLFKCSFVAADGNRRDVGSYAVDLGAAVVD